jgi:hypothetical protein
VTVALLSLAAFLGLLALLAWQVQPATLIPARRVALVRRIYQTTVIETVIGTRGGSTVTQSTSVSVGSYAAPPVTTRTS